MVRKISHPARKQRVKKTNQSIPFGFVLDRLESCSPVVRPMFGCHAIYLGEKIVLILRKKANAKYDNGVWLATSEEHHSSLREKFPGMRPIRLFGGKSSAWQNLPVDSDDFEESVMTACEMVMKNDPRIGKIPKRKAAGKG